MAKVLHGKDIQLVSGFQLCHSCFEEAQTHCHDVSEVEDYDIAIASDSYSSEAEEDPSEKHPKIDLDDSLQSNGISPIKTHSMLKHVKVSYAREKVDNTMSTLRRSFATAIGIEEEDLCKTENTKLPDKQKENEKKANDLDELMAQIKDKLPSCDYRTKIQILTLTPDSWSRNFAADFFGVSEYLVRTVHEVKIQNGILAIPERKSGKTLSITVTDAVHDFFENDEHTRLMPGRKDFVSIKRNVHKQRHLLLCPGGGVMPYMWHTEMCRRSGYTFWPSNPRQGACFRTRLQTGCQICTITPSQGAYSQYCLAPSRWF